MDNQLVAFGPTTLDDRSTGGHTINKQGDNNSHPRRQLPAGGGGLQLPGPGPPTPVRTPDQGDRKEAIDRYQPPTLGRIWPLRGVDDVVQEHDGANI